MALFVGGPYDGVDIDVDPKLVRRIRLPDPDSTAGTLLDALLRETVSDDRTDWPHKYLIDDAGTVPVYRYIGSSGSSHASLVLFVGGPYDGERLPVDVRNNEVRLPPEELIDEFYADPNQTASLTWPFVYHQDSSGSTMVYRFIETRSAS